MAGNGPAPKDPAHRRRTNRTGATTTKLPAAGRTGSPPRWPLRAARPAHWASLWKLPQATVWEQQGVARVVARYALLLELAEAPDASAALLSEVRQLEDRLGLNPKAMRSLLWVVATEEPTSQVAPTGAEAARARLRVV